VLPIGVRPLKVEIITIGNEVISGYIIDRNAAFLADAVSAEGAHVTRIVSVGDDINAIASTLHEALGRADLLVVTGGLGATPDDLTVKAAAQALNRKITRHQKYLETLRAKFKKYKLTITASDERMAHLPEGSEPLPNPIGLCGFKLEERGKAIFFFPGVHREVKGLTEGALLPLIRERLKDGEREVVRSALLKVFGPTEAQIQEAIPITIGTEVEMASLPTFPETHLKVVVRGVDPQEVAARLRQTEDAIAARLGVYLFGRGEDSMEGVVGRLLVSKGATIAVAESCTGGLVSHRITDVAGSSHYFLRGVVAYSNRAKEELLGVSSALLEQYGPVSKEVAQQMANGVRASSKADIGLATTGIAGPGGGTTKTPVGRVFIAVAADQWQEVKEYDFFGDRHQVNLMASEVALDRVRRYLLGFTS
jgi:nicotinamide-nucleotide amidase